MNTGGMWSEADSTFSLKLSQCVVLKTSLEKSTNPNMF